MTPMTSELSLKMSELAEGMVIEYYGMELLLTDRHQREEVYWFTGLIQNTEEVDARGIVPPTWRLGGKWHVQGNDLVAHRVIKTPDNQGGVMPEPIKTPYDTGVRLEPKPWHVQPANLSDFEEADRYGRVDFDNDAGETVAQVLAQRGPSGPILTVTDWSEWLTIKYGDTEIKIAPK